MAAERPPGRLSLLLVVARPTLTAVGMVLAYYLLPLDERFDGATIAGLVVGLIAVAALFVGQIRGIVRSPYPKLRALEALATTLPLFLLLFSTSYYLLERATPGSFTETMTRTDALYFTLTVFSTVGFGDITPRTETARVVTMAQMAGDILVVGVAARVVIGAVQTGLRRQGRGAGPGGV